MKTIVLFILIRCLYISSYAQSGLSFKIYQNTDIFKTEYTDDQPGHVRTENNINFIRISMAVNLQTKKGLGHEIEFLMPEFSKPIQKLQFPIHYKFRKGNTSENMAASYSFRYEMHKLFADHSDRIDFLFGVGLNPYYVKLEYTPAASNDYYSSLTLFGIAVNVTPRLYYKLNQFFSIDLNAPIRLYNFQVEKYRIDNPIFPIRQQRRRQNNHLFFEPAYTIRLGLRYSLHK
ncbi:MAG: hypothetical protein WBP41_11030 [Saprospiraceae bacterium]